MTGGGASEHSRTAAEPSAGAGGGAGGRYFGFWAAARLNVFAVALSALWTPLNSLVLPGLVDERVPGELRGSALGVLTFLGIGIAVVAQPVFGRASDRWPSGDRRRPFIVVGALVGAPLAVALGVVPGFLLLLLVYVLLQLASNAMQARSRG